LQIPRYVKLGQVQRTWPQGLTPSSGSCLARGEAVGEVGPGRTDAQLGHAERPHAEW
jgi:hypothetical protein